MIPVQDVTVVYGGGGTRTLQYKDNKPISVSGDANSTRLVFDIPSPELQYSIQIEFGIRIPGIDPYTLVTPFYPLVYDEELQRYTHELQPEITSRARNSFIPFSLKFFEGETLVEMSLPLGLYINADATEGEPHRSPEFIILQGEIDQEIIDRTEADTELQNGILLEKEERIEADGILQGNILLEEEARTEADEALQSSLDAETSARQSADETLQANIDSEESDRISADATLQANIDAEATARQSADATLQSNIDAEAGARASADTTLQANIDAEAGTRASADASLQSNIDAEESARTQADTNLQNQIDQQSITLDTKRDKITDEHTVPVAYVQTADGHEGLQNIVSNDTTGGSLVARTNDGTVKATTPQANNDVTNKEYVDSAISNIQSAVDTHIADVSNPHQVTKAQVGLSNVDNTSDADKPISTATQAAIDAVSSSLNAHIDNVSNPHSVTKAQVGLGSVENHSLDAAPTQDSDNYVKSGGVYSAIDYVDDKVDVHIASTDNPHSVTKAQVGLGSVVNTTMDSAPTEDSGNYVSSGGVYTAIEAVSGDIDSHISNVNNPHSVTKAQVGLGNVDNTSDVNKPVSTAQQNAIDAVDSKVDSHIANKSNPHGVTKAQVGLGNVDNTSDVNKPVSTAQRTAIDQVQTNLDTHAGTLADSTTYGHVKFDENVGITTNRTDVTISESGIKAYVNSSIGTATANFLGTYDAVSDLGIAQSVVDTYTYTPTPAVEASVGSAIASELASQGTTASANDYVFVSVNKSTTVDIDWYWRFKYGGGNWLYEYTLNNSSFTQAQWDSINSGITTSKVSTYDSHVASRSNPHGVTKAQVGLGNADNTSDANKPVSTAQQAAIDAVESKVDDHIVDKSNPHSVTKSQVGLGNVDNTSDANKPISTATQTALNNKIGSVNQTGSGYVSAVAVDSTDKTKLNVTRTAIPSITTSDSGSGDIVTGVSASGHALTIAKTYTRVTSVTGWSSTTSDTNIPSEKLVKSELDKKQVTLVGSGTGQNIKTINSSSILGSGNIVLQVPLVGSGTGQNIKTINSTSLLGSGNIALQVPLVGSGTGQNLKTVDGTNLLGSGDISVGVKSVKVNGNTYTPSSGLVTLPNYPTGNVQSDWNAVDGLAVILNKPTKLSQFDNDTGFITGLGFDDLSSHPTTLAGYGITDALPSNTTFATINGTSVKSDTTFSLVPTSRKINGKALTADISLGASDVSALPSNTAFATINGTSVKSNTAFTLATTDTQVAQVLKTDNYDRPLLMSDQIISATTASPVGEARRNNSIYANTSTGMITSTLIDATQVGGLTKTYTSGANTTRVVLARVNNYTGNASCRIRLEVSGSGGIKTAYIDAIWAGAGQALTIESVYSSNNAIRYFFCVVPKSTNYYTSNPPEIHIQQSSAVARTIKATILERCGDVVLMDDLTTTGNTTNRNSRTYDVNNNIGVFDNVGYVQNSGWAGGAWDRLDNDRYLFGEAVVNLTLGGVGSDGKVWKLSRTDKEFLLPLDMGNCTGTFAASASYGRMCKSIRGLGWGNFTNTTAQTTAFTVPTLTVNDYGKLVYLVGTINSNGHFVSSRKVTLSMDVPASGSLTYIPIGKIDHLTEAIATTAPTTWSLISYNTNAFTIDSNGKLTHVNGVAIKDADIAVEVVSITES